MDQIGKRKESEILTVKQLYKNWFNIICNLMFV